jgi:hypothetical protein
MDIAKHIYIGSGAVTERVAQEKCGLLTVRYDVLLNMLLYPYTAQVRL